LDFCFVTVGIDNVGESVMFNYIFNSLTKFIIQLFRQQ